MGETASNCSWHLRALEKVSLVERAPRAPDGDGRTRPWRATAVGFVFSDPADDGPGAAVARTALAGISAAYADDLYRRYLARQDDLPDAWTRAAGDSSYALSVTTDELEALLGRIDALIRPYVRPIRQDAPEDAGIVQVTLRAFLNPA